MTENEHFMRPVDEVIAAFATSAEDGLTAAGAELSARERGSNRLTARKQESLLRRVFGAATEPMILMLIAAGVIDVIVNVIRAMTGSEADYLEAVGVFAAISLSVAITVIMEGRSAKAFEALSKISDNTQVKAVRDGQVTMLAQGDIVCGDILLLATGDRIPADGRLVEAVDLRVNESALTGESMPVAKDAAFTCDDVQLPVAERANMLYSGTFITDGHCRMVVTAVGDATEFGKIAHELAETDRGSTPLQEKLARLGKLITILGVTAAAIVFASELISFSIHGALTLENALSAFVTSIVLIVAAVPEGLPTIVAVSLSLSIIRLSRENALVKKMIASETVGCVNVICSDKTGTLTENRMTVIDVWRCAPGAAPERFDPAALPLDATRDLIDNFCLNGTADLAGDGSFIGNPTEGALLVAARAAGVGYAEVRDASTIERVFPFSSDEKHMTTVARRGEGAVCLMKGSPERVLATCAIDKTERRAAEQLIEDAQRKAYRVIAFAHRELPRTDAYEHDDVERDLTFDGFVTISDPLRADVMDAVAQCRKAGVELKILTGDNVATAAAIAEQLDILDDGRRAVEARHVETLTDEELLRELPNIAVIARSTPAIKMRVVKLLRGSGNVVAVTGDGVNDAPALKNADVGIAMGISGTEVSKEASDIVLLDDAFSTIVNAVRWGRGIYENFKRFISFQLTVNVASVICVFVSILLGLDAPFNALELLWVNIIMDGPPALTLGLEPSYTDLMGRRPTRRSDNIVGRTMLIRIIGMAVYMSVIFLAQYTGNFLGASPEQERTVLFTLFALFQLFNAFNCRELHATSIFSHLFANKLMLGVVGTTFVLQVLIIQFAGAFFGTVPLPLDMWLKLFALSASVIVLSEAVRALLRLRNRLGHAARA